jgi:catalase
MLSPEPRQPFIEEVSNMHVDKPIQQRMINNLTKANQELGKAVAKGLKL